MLKPDIEQAYLDSVPCSIQKIVVVTGYYPKLSEPSVNQRKLAFRDWVAYDLYGGSAKHKRDHIKCPLIGCAIRFDNLESCLFHLPKCAWLDNAWYWCPFCTRPERFTDPESSSASPVKSEPSPTASEPASSSDQKGPKSRSAAARLLKNIGSKLGSVMQNQAVGPCTNMNTLNQGTERPPRWRIRSSVAVMHRSAPQQPGGHELEAGFEHEELQGYMRTRPAEPPSLYPFKPDYEVHPYTQDDLAELPSPDPSRPRFEVLAFTQIRSEPSTQGEDTVPMHATLEGPPVMGMSCYDHQDSYHEAQYQHLSDDDLQDPYHGIPYQHPPHSLSDPNANVYQNPAGGGVQSVYSQDSTYPNYAPDKESLWPGFLSEASLASNVWPLPQITGHARELRGDADEDNWAFGSQAPFPFIPNHEPSAPFISPTSSTMSIERDSNSPSNSDTQLNSAEASPSSGTLSIFPANADTQAPIPLDTSLCPICDTPFTGTFQHRMSNLNRHIKYKHRGLGKFRCQTEGCNKEYTRPDNLLKHQRVKHPNTQLRASQRTTIEMHEYT
ncbi:MAG: hypothetical protein Q9208_002974 [Pyrenodesmia sp. 3 TL-2023]